MPVSLGANDVAVICMMRNAEYYLNELLHHHRALGARHFVFIDNGSEDGSVALLSEQGDVTVLENRLPVATYENLIRQQAARLCVRGGWLLFIDTDELAEFPGRRGSSLSDYANYCNRHGYDVVVAQMLDLYSPLPLSEAENMSYTEAIRTFDRYSLHRVTELDYSSEDVPFAYFLSANTISNPDICIKFGGIRLELFGENCTLTKHPFVRNTPSVEIYSHAHCSSAARCADFSFLIRHYKFAGDFIAREQRQILAKTWDHGENEQRLSIIGERGYKLQSPYERRFVSADHLVAEGFLDVSTNFSGEFLTTD
jgi:hypothetical protein